MKNTNEYNFIRDFNKISATKIIKKHNFGAGNFYSGKLSKERQRIVAKELFDKIVELLAKYFEVINNE